ncbi:CBS domain-containing protein [Thiohalomonas denitrificans]|uniref:CBS domain-containing protein n=1 Tax=Thiohalomonas denitrificans TaxID=415747 RepID=A0A1G5PRL5_9GAMM|nr:CBS domain-containing protein [Thiohalomonas denitrificans]SCZ52082.1 CBS domain-containing protein [Thiohalomonas denitrificans]
MTSIYRPLPYSSLDSDTGYHRPSQRLPERVCRESAALEVMTDLTQVAAMTIGPCATLEAVEERMIASNVRLLLVTDQHNSILGIITSTDLKGERPMQYLKEVGGKRKDIFVRDIMTPRERIEVLYLEDVNTARVGDIVETLKRVGRQHALVVDRDADGRQSVRGIFSTKQIGKQLGVAIETTEIAKTFAELEAALA